MRSKDRSVMEVNTSNITDKKILSRKRRLNIFHNIMMAATLLLLAASCVIAAMILTSCESVPDVYPAAEEKVKEDLKGIKDSESSDSLLESLYEFADDGEESLISGYVNKVKDFDYEILGSAPTEDREKDKAVVTVRITTYDFGNAYVKAWNEYVESEEYYYRSDAQLIASLMTKFASLSSKDYKTDVDIICTSPNGDDIWITDIGPENAPLMDALSGGMLEVAKSLSGDEDTKDTDSDTNN